jgi:hypothetical protein
MKIYHFLPEKWALEALNKQRLKVSKFNDLNDPFELMAMSMEDKFSRSFLSELKEKLNDKLRLLSCSRDWSSPLLWGHYADKHKGIALRLEVPSDSVTSVTYAKDRTEIDLNALMEKNDEKAKQVMFEMFTTKYDQWSYEEEVRVQFESSEVFSEGEFDFYALGDDINITGLVLGPLNSTSTALIKKNIPCGKEVEVITTRIAFRSFNVVHQKQKPPYRIGD